MKNLFVYTVIYLSALSVKFHAYWFALKSISLFNNHNKLFKVFAKV